MTRPVNLSYFLHSALVCVAAAACLVVASPHQAGAAVSTVDSFEGVDITLTPSGIDTSRDETGSLVAASRRVSGPSTSLWSAELSSVAGSLTYSIATRGARRPYEFALFIDYNDLPDRIDLSPFTALEFSVTELTGEGLLYASVNSSDPTDSPPIPIDSTGSTLYQISRFNASTFIHDITNLSFWVAPASDDFSITISEIRAIPEPEPMALVFLTASVIAFKRRRAHSQPVF